jgi:hypothetical protein
MKNRNISSKYKVMLELDFYSANGPVLQDPRPAFRVNVTNATLKEADQT